MAAENRSTPDHLTFLTESAAETKRFGLFAIARGAEARAAHLPRIGRARRPAQNVADFTQVPTLAFPDATLAEVEVREGRARVGGYWLGLTGPMGPMPSHITEFAAFERRYAKSRPFGRWLDLLAGRMLQLFVRVWADSQPAAQADRPDDDRFASHLSQLTGASEGVAADEAFPAAGRALHAALFAGRRSVGALEDALNHLLGQLVRIEEYRPRWRDVEAEDRSRLGRQFAGLGDEAMLGGRVRVVSDAFRVIIRAKTPADYAALLPGGARFRVLSEAIDAFAPSHLDWDVALEVSSDAAGVARLDGGTRLGWSGWVGGGGGRVRNEAHLRRTVPTNVSYHHVSMREI